MRFFFSFILNVWLGRDTNSTTRRAIVNKRYIFTHCEYAASAAAAFDAHYDAVHEKNIPYSGAYSFMLHTLQNKFTIHSTSNNKRRKTRAPSLSLYLTLNFSLSLFFSMSHTVSSLALAFSSWIPPKKKRVEQLEKTKELLNIDRKAEKQQERERNREEKKRAKWGKLARKICIVIERNIEHINENSLISFKFNVNSISWVNARKSARTRIQRVNSGCRVKLH